ncbi:GGDEF domain-containing protein [Castellaniella sp.]|uniref:GGDEF domain-containing protein n=1 Tax=Castellaniella sp. TaxID=1955812 RepID=UPI002AFDFA40|nr:GGDEF domain-containing protein [Castellaniella sp.]
MCQSIASSLSWARRSGPFLSLTALAFLLIYFSLMFHPLLGDIGFWQANALLAGALLRVSSIPHRYRWPGVILGVMAAYAYWYDGWDVALLNTLVNLSGVWLAWFLLHRVWPLDTMRTPRAITHVLLAGLAASACTALAGLIGYQTSTPLPLDMPLRPIIGIFFQQWLGYSAILPVCLLPTSPGRSLIDRRRSLARILHQLLAGSRQWPLLVLLGSILLAALLGGPGTAAFPVPALLICAYAYQQKTCAWLTLAASIALMVSHTQGWALVASDIPSVWVQVSLQIGLQMMVATPLMVSSSLMARNDLVQSLNQALDHDELTGAMSRQAFMRGATEYLQQSPAAFYGNCVMMLDIDHFKRLNDNHGHAAGDSVLREFARIIQSAIRPEDLFGRLGGEEFGIVLPNTTLRDSLEIGERLRKAVEEIRLYYDSDEPLRVTVSIGTIHDSQKPHATMTQLLALADQVMYQAKHEGRNRVLSLSAGQLRDLNPAPLT